VKAKQQSVFSLSKWTNTIYREAFDHAPVGICFTSIDGRFLHVNQTLCNFLGYKREELLGMGFIDVTHPDDQEASSEVLRKGLQSQNQKFSLEKRYVTKSGEIVWVWIQTQYVSEAANEPSFFISHIIDISDKKETERKLLETAHFPEENPFPIIRVDPQGMILYANPASQPLLRQWNTGLGAQLPEDLRLLASNAFIEKKSFNYEIDMAGRCLSLLIAPIVEANHINIYSRDMTAQRRLEEQIRQVQNEESLGRLAGGIAHDLNNLLMPILAYSEMALEDLQPEAPLYASIQQIKIAAERARDLAGQLVAFGRKQVLSMKVLNLNEVLQQNTELLKQLIRPSVEMTFSLAPDLWPIEGDASQLSRILMNLVANANDAMPEGGSLALETSNVVLDQVYASTHAETSPGEYVMLAISDTGSGMDSETASHIFEPFFTTKSKTKGTGLGLPTVYGIVKQHRGNIWVYSEPDHGTTFKVYIPRTFGKHFVTEPATEQLSKAQATETILVVEDDQTVRSLVLSILESEGYHVLSAEGPEQALQISNDFEGHIDLLLTDVMMPQMNGRVLCRQMRSSRSDLRVLYMSGYTNNIISRQGVLEPGVQFIQKPFNVRSLLNKVREALQEPQAL